MRIALFLDIDGVLNGHEQHSNSYCGIDPLRADHLNTILAACSDVDIVISSAWRYMIHPDAMTLKGFEYLLMVCGVDCPGRIVGHTVRDEVIPLRENQIRDYAIRNALYRFVVLADLPLDMPELVQTEADVGLTAQLAEEVIRRLRYG